MPSPLHPVPAAATAASWLARFAAVLLLSCLTVRAATAFRDDPDYLIDTWETEDGLPENSATAMVQDADGYLWFGTFAGLVRYDGVKFQTVEMPLPNSAVVNLHLDHADRLWVSTYKGMAVREGGRWREVAEDDAWEGDQVRTFSERADGALLVTTFHGRIAEGVNGRFTELPPPPGQQGQGYLGAVDEAGKWCVVQNKFIGNWDGARWTPLVPAEELTGLNGDEVSVTPARGGGLWILLGRELRKYRNGAVTERRTLQAGYGGVWSLFEDSAGNIWISSYHAGLSHLSPDGNMRRWEAGSGVHPARRFVFEDREGNLWGGSSGGGLQRMRPRRFQAFVTDIKQRNISTVAPAPSGMWAGTFGDGLYRIENGRVTHDTPPGVAYVQSVLTDRTGRTWLGTLEQGLWRQEGGTWHRLPDELAAGGNVVALFEDSRGRVWLSDGGGVSVHESGAVRTLPPLKSVTCFAEDAAGNIWLGSDRGVFRVEENNYVPVSDDTGAPLPGAFCMGCAGGDLWIYTTRHALLRWRDEKLTRAPYEGEPVSGLVGGAAGALWLNTGRGVIRWLWDGSGAPQHRNFDTSDGLPGIEGANMRQSVCTRDAAGRLWFATTKGVASIDPAHLRLNSVAPPVHFESLVYRLENDGAETETKLDLFPGSPPHTLNLPPGSRRVEFHFSAPSFSAPERMQFAMQLEQSGARRGGTDQWTDAGSRRVIEFFDLSPGDYTLRVRAANNDGVWSKSPAMLGFTVQPHYWQTIWFRTGVVLLLLGLGGAFVWWLMRFRQARMEEKLALQQQRGELAHLGRVASMSELSGSLAHELNQPLAAILSNAQAAQRFMDQDPPDLTEVREILTDIVHEDRRAGEVIRRMRGMLKKGEAVLEVLHLDALAEEVLGMISSDLVARNVSVTTEFAPALPPVYGDRIQFQQVILNLLINACDAMTETDSSRRLLTVTTAAAGSGVVLCVRDHGHGLEAGTEEKIFAPFYTTKTGGLGMGLAICRSILTAHAGRLTAENHPDGGAVLRMELPAHPDELHD